MTDDERYLAARTVSDVWICYPWEATYAIYRIAESDGQKTDRMAVISMSMTNLQPRRPDINEISWLHTTTDMPDKLSTSHYLPAFLSLPALSLYQQYPWNPMFYSMSHCVRATRCFYKGRHFHCPTYLLLRHGAPSMHAAVARPA